MYVLVYIQAVCIIDNMHKIAKIFKLINTWFVSVLLFPCLLPSISAQLPSQIPEMENTQHQSCIHAVLMNQTYQCPLSSILVYVHLRVE